MGTAGARSYVPARRQPTALRVVLADDDTATRQLLRATLDRTHDIEVVGEATDGASAIALTGSVRPDVLLLDLSMPGIDGFAVLSEVRYRAPEVLVAVHSGLDRALTGLGPEDGVAAYLSKDLSPDEVVSALRSLDRSRTSLVPRPRRAGPPVTVDLLERLRTAMALQQELLAPDLDRAAILATLSDRARATTGAAGACVVARDGDALVQHGGCGWLRGPDAGPVSVLAVDAARAALGAGEPSLLRSGNGGPGRPTAVALAVPLPTTAAGEAALVVVGDRPDAFAAHARHLLGLVAPLAATRLDLDASQVAQREAERRCSEVLDSRQRGFSEALQRSLLTEPPQSPGLRVAVRYQPAVRDVQVGGDWYDALRLPSGDTLLAIGDVVGHDVPAAVMMSQLRGYLRGIAYTTGEGPAALLSRLDGVMEGLDLRTLASAIVAHVADAGPAGSSAGVRLTWANAGHPPPVLVDPDGGVRLLDALVADCLLGVDADSTRQDHVAVLPPGSTVLLYTDGLVERHGSDLGEGIGRLTGVLAALGEEPLEPLCDEVLHRLVGEGSEDDVALLALRVQRS